MRQRIHEVIELTEGRDRLSLVYDLVMMTTIIVSLIPLAFKHGTPVLDGVSITTGYIFIADYLLRWSVADLKLKKGKLSFLMYPITPMAIIDLLAILSALTPLVSGVRMVKMFRLVRTFRVFQTLKLFRFSKGMQIVLKVFKEQRGPLFSVVAVAVGYVLISALVMFNIEPDTFQNYFDAVYWVTITLTSVGYGDIVPLSIVGKLITILSSFVGIGLVSLPAGILAAGYMRWIDEDSGE